MAYAPHIRVSALGTLGVERFSYSINLRAQGVLPSLLGTENAQTWTNIADDVADFHGRAATHIDARAELKEVKIAEIGADGKYTQDPIIKARVQAGGGGVQAFVLPQTALAISLMTDRRGATGRGRFYIPMPVLDPDATDGWRVPTGPIDAVLGSAKSFLEALGNSAGFDLLTGLKVVVASTKGYNSDVTGVRVGRVVDTIRSRRGSLSESYRVDDVSQ